MSTAPYQQRVDLTPMSMAGRDEAALTVYKQATNDESSNITTMNIPTRHSNQDITGICVNLLVIKAWVSRLAYF